MKTTRRHELQTNELADSLARWIEAVKPYSRALLALVVAAVVAIFAWGYLSTQNSRQEAEGWNAYFKAITDRDPREALGDIATRYSGTEVSEWARVTLADVQLLQGTDRLFTDKAEARNELRQAIEKYRAVLADTRQPMLQQRATFGLARAHETLATPDAIASARKEYRSIGEQWPDSPYVKDANRRADDLDQTATKQFYDWVARYEPPRPLANEPGTPGARPDFLKDPLDDLGPSLPSATEDLSLPKLDTEPGASPAGDAPTTEEPKSDASPADDAQPPSNEAEPAPSEAPPAPSEAPPAPDEAAPPSDAPPAPSDEPPAPEAN